MPLVRKNSLADPDPSHTGRVTKAFLLKKFDLRKLEEVYEGVGV